MQTEKLLTFFKNLEFAHRKLMNRTLKEPDNEKVNDLWQQGRVLHKRATPTLERDKWREVWNMVFETDPPTFEDTKEWAANGDNDRFLFEKGRMLELKLSGRFEIRQVEQDGPEEQKGHVESVAEFIRQMPNDQQAIPAQPLTSPPADLRKSIAKLIFEEAMETIRALGISIYINVKELPNDVDEVKVEGVTFHDDWAYDRQEAADGLGDLSVVTIGGFLRLGIHPMPVLKAIDKANLDKLKEGHWFREDGKLMKPDDWEPPSIEIRPYRE